MITIDCSNITVLFATEDLRYRHIHYANIQVNGYLIEGFYHYKYFYQEYCNAGTDDFVFLVKTIHNHNYLTSDHRTRQ